MNSMRRVVMIAAIVVGSLSSASGQTYKTQAIHGGPLWSNASIPDDFDHDGDTDLIVIRRALDGAPPAIEWLENDAAHQFPRHVIYSDSTLARPFDIKKCDCDGDGRTDYVISEGAGIGEQGQLFIIQRQPNDTFIKWTVQAGADFDQADVADFNHDGRPDIVAVGGDKPTVDIYLNNGGFSFTKLTIATNVSSGGVVQAADIDGDGDIDIITGGLIFRNNGNGTFDAGQQIGTSFYRAVTVTDLNGDGKMDVLAFTGNGAGGLVFYDGSKNFSSSIIDKVGIDLGGDIQIADIDGNGLKDIIRETIGDNQLTVLYQDAQLQFRRVSLDNSWFNGGETRMTIADLDGDGDPDLVVPGGTNGAPDFSWFENIGGRLFEHRLYTTFVGAHAVKLADIDGDGDLDIVLTASGGQLPADTELLWLENRGASGFVTWRISESIKYPADVAVADVNGDGRPDVIVSARDSNALYWYERSGNDWTQHTIDTSLNLPLGIAAADLDRDGDIDVVATSSGDAKVFWYANDGHGVFQRRFVDVNLVNARAVKVADLDGDGDLDIAAVATSDMNSVAVYLNTGSQTFTRQILQTGFNAYDLDIGDRNGNGKPDIVAVLYTNNQPTDRDIVAFEQTQGSSFSTTILATGLDNLTAVKLADVDGDGDLDLLIGNDGFVTATPPLQLFTNIGGGAYSKPLPLLPTGVLHTILSIDTGNLDDDNSIEIVAADQRTNSLLRLDNVVGGGPSAPSIAFSAETSTINVGDPVTLNWSTINATTVTIDNNIGQVAAAGTFTRHNIATNTTFILTATGPGGIRKATVMVLVNNPLSAGITVLPQFIHTGDSATLIWSSTGGTTVTINDGSGPQAVAAQGTKTVSPSSSTHYTLAVQANNVTVGSSTDLTVTSAPPPIITSFVAVPPSIQTSAPITLMWSSSGGTSTSIDRGVGNVPASGMVVVTPATTTTYTLVVRGAGGVTMRSATVVVKDAPAPTVSTLAGNGTAGSTDGPASTASFMKPFAVAAMPHTAGLASIGRGLQPDASISFDIYILDSNHTIRRIGSDGMTSTFAGSAGVRGTKNGFRTDATFDFSNYTGAIVANSDGSFEVVDANGVQRHIDTAGNVANACAACARFPLPAGVVRLADRTTYISDAGNHTITRVSSTGLTTVIGITGQAGLRDGAADQAEFNRPRGLTVDSAGNVYVLDTGNNAVRKISALDFVSTLSIPGSSTTAGGDLNLGCCASGITPAPGGGVYIVDPGSNTVKQVGSDGSITTVAGSGSSGSTNGSGASASFDSPLGITTAPDGSLIVTDTNNNTVRSITPPPSPAKRRAVKH